MKLLVINGPNLNMLGIREPEIYGRTTYADLVKYIEEVCAREGIEVRCVQSNHEGTIVDYIQDAYQKVDGIVMNPAAYTLSLIHIFNEGGEAVPTVWEKSGPYPIPNQPRV